ncbi:sensor histidine kinase [Nocardioides sp. T2.26MG-1]|uniref:sensor histidine kinase n=1 Tax=Nocardioides sp. T2.26MG-1 TaxID=3041166 RepID=UPI002477450F|nr:HAMP domain-containing sensor histidine kinase [Nocardioides sp. T2.26MG-1]CAI9412593.1 Adaptive-response sensory-kinase SasA [Nocardioides sp. T2.26MG-1]
MSESLGSPDLDRPVRASRWSDAQSREALQAIAEGVAEVAGFELVGVSVVREDGYLQIMVLVGPEEARKLLIDSLAPLAPMVDQLALADDWGTLKFIPHERLILDLDRWGWVADRPRDHVEPGKWHPQDQLVAPLRGADGTLLGTLAMELPRDGLIPGPAQRETLEFYARQAARAVVATLEHERLAEQVRLARAAADVVRLAVGTQSPDRVLAECGRAITDGFRAESLWIQRIGPDGRCDGPLYVDGGPTVRLPAGIRALASAHSRRAWERQCVAVLAPERPVTGVLGPEQHAEVIEFLAGLEVESLLFVPMGAGRECFGAMGLTRRRGGAEWSEEEAATALEIGRDLGRALANARTLEREHQLVDELRELADYKERLLATVSHEMKNPLSAILGYVEILGAEPGLSDTALACVAAIERGGGRLAQVVGDLLLLHESTGIEASATAEPVDLGQAVTEVVDLNDAVARARRQTLRTELPDVPVLALAEPRDVDHIVTNLLGNALKYTPDGGTIAVSVERVGDQAVLCCTDSGIGIAEEEQARLFDEFFRSTDPAAVAQPGSGLGLAIVRRVVERHRGRIEVESAIGRGSTFRVFLPAAG